MKTLRGLLAVSVASSALAAGAAGAQASDDTTYFTRIATMPVYASLPAGVDPATETVAEIIAATPDGMTVVHTDSPGEDIVFVDITEPAAPRPLGRTALGGEPTSVTVVGDYALAGVNTAESFTNPSGHVAVINVKSRKIVARCDVSGQPDAVAASPDGRFLAVAIENERDEDLNDGIIPQLPAGHLSVLTLGGDGMPTNCDAPTTVDLTGLAEVAPTDPEPEFVSVNSDNVAVVTMQENNHLALVDLASGTVTRSFSAGTASLSNIPTEKARMVDGTGSLTDVPREPDAVSWIDDDRFVTANEGDYDGGSRGFTIWNTDGEVLYDSAALMEHLGMMHGHYPAKRAHKKGVEPEGTAVGTYGDDTLLFVNSERANFVAVFKDMGAGQAPEFLQFLPTNVGPEGLLAIPSRDLFVVASEEDSAEDGVRASVGIYQRGAAMPAYPTIASATDPATDAPIGWGALSGLAADPQDPARLYAVSDSFYDEARIFTIDAGATPARITGYVTLHGGEAEKYDLEGIALRSGGGFWAVSEGHPKKGLDNLLLAVAEDGTVEQEIPLPATATARMARFGFEGVTEMQMNGETRVVAAVQREWGDDPKGMTKLAVYSPASKTWGFVHYPLDAPESPAGGWVGLSEITDLGNGRVAILERDNKAGRDAAIKRLYTVDLADVTPAAAGEALPVVEKTLVLDILPSMAATEGWTPDKVEGFAVTADGQMIAVTDNDGVDDATGETQFLRLGPVAQAVN